MVVEILRQLHGAARLGELLAAGASRSELRRACERGQVLRPAYGCFALPDAPADHLAACMTPGSLTCLSSARAHGLWLLREPEVPHLLVRCGRQGSFVPHRHDGTGRTPRIVDVAETVRQAAHCLPALEALVIAESCVAKGLLSVAGMSRALDFPAGRNIARLIDPQAQSLLETVARWLLMEAGYSVQSQVYFPGVGHVDLLVEGRVVVELDGFEFHSAREDYRRDRLRWNSPTCAGLPVLRFTFEMVVARPGYVLACVREALAQPAHG